MPTAPHDGVTLDAPVPNRRGELLGLARGVARMPTLFVRRDTVPRGDGSPVLVLPGLMTGDGSTLVLRRWLSALGHDVRPWSLGFNDGRLARLVPAAQRRLRELSDATGSRVSLVGWSLGGVISRELARTQPQAVKRIVTMGTPVVGGPKYTSARWIYERRGLDLDAFERRVDARNQTPISAPITAIYSRKDAVVAWQACLDPNPANDVEHVEVDAYHSELGFCPEVLEIVARRLV